MLRLLLAVLVVAPIAPSVYAAPILKDKSETIYYPTQVGAIRVMDTSSNGGAFGVSNVQVTETVTKVEQKEGKYLVTVSSERKENKVALPEFVFEVSNKGILRVQYGGRVLPQPSIVLQLPAKPGDSWKINNLTYEVGKEETIEVPAGKFKAIPISMEQSVGESKVITTSWYAPKVGLIKTVMVLNESERTTVLKSFTPGK